MSFSPSAALPPSEEGIAFAKRSFKFADVNAALKHDTGLLSERAQLIQDIARNAKKRQTIATSGVVMPYVLSMSTNFMDPLVARRICTLGLAALEAVREQAGIRSDEQVLLVGMEVAGGIFISQLAAVGGPALAARYQCVYMRKAKKASGAGQQLEGAAAITERTSELPPIRAIWVDDVNATGSSLTAGVETLRKDYNIHVVAAFYVVDRPADRQALDLTKTMYYAQPQFYRGITKVFALIDLAEIDAAIAEQQQAKSAVAPTA